MSLYPTPGEGGYCGPTAIAAVSRYSVADAEQAILAWRRSEWSDRMKRRHPRGPFKVRGLYMCEQDEMTPVLKRLGITFAKAVYKQPRPTLRRWANGKDRAGTFIVELRTHFIAVDTSEWTYTDTRQRYPTSLEHCPYPRHRVWQTWRIT